MRKFGERERMTHNSHPILVIGLLGGIGSGKSSVAAAFARRGARVIVGDDIGHQALKQSEIKEQLVRRWGRDVLDERDEIDRRKVAGIVFHDPAQRQDLEAIVFPWIGRRVEEEVRKAQDDPGVRFVVLDAAVMLEAGWARVCDKLVFIDAPPAVRQMRVAEQRGWATHDLEARESAQLPLTAKRARADHVLENSASLENLERQVDHLCRLWGLATAEASQR